MPPTSHEIMPGRFVTERVHALVQEALFTLAANTIPTWSEFTHPASVYAIPDPTGAPSKVEIILTDTPTQTIKVNHWYLADRRRGHQPTPHNHRWRTMRSRILTGGYRDHVYWSDPDTVTDQIRTHSAGDTNRLDHHEFHEVTDVEPGTWTCFVGTRSQPGDWGYLDPNTGRYTHNQAMTPDPGFPAAFRALNPHLP